MDGIKPDELCYRLDVTGIIFGSSVQPTLVRPSSATSLEFVRSLWAIFAFSVIVSVLSSTSFASLACVGSGLL